MWIGTIPYRCRDLVIAAPGKKMFLIVRAPGQQEPGPGKFHRIAPDARESPARFVDEVPKILLPAAVEVAEEQHSLLVIDHHPPGEMNGRDAHQFAIDEEEADQGPGKE